MFYHGKCSCYVENCLKVAFFGKTNIAEQLCFRHSVSGRLLRGSGDSMTYHKVMLKIDILM